MVGGGLAGMSAANTVLENGGGVFTGVSTRMEVNYAGAGQCQGKLCFDIDWQIVRYSSV